MQNLASEGTTTTFDNDYLTADKIIEYYIYKMWNKRYGKVISMDETMKF